MAEERKKEAWLLQVMAELRAASMYIYVLRPWPFAHVKTAHARRRSEKSSSDSCAPLSTAVTQLGLRLTWTLVRPCAERALQWLCRLALRAKVDEERLKARHASEKLGGPSAAGVTSKSTHTHTRINVLAEL